MFTNTSSVQFTSDTHQYSLQYTNMSRFTQQQGNKIDWFFFVLQFFIPITSRDLIVPLLAKHKKIKSRYNRVKKNQIFVMLCKYALLHTSISCYTSTVTSMFHIAVRHTPCGVSIKIDTPDFQFSVLCLQDEFQSRGSTFQARVRSFPWGHF